jgi:uncharacterized protein YggT (Ycf19 family)
MIIGFVFIGISKYFDEAFNSSVEFFTNVLNFLVANGRFLAGQIISRSFSWFIIRYPETYQNILMHFKGLRVVACEVARQVYLYIHDIVLSLDIHIPGSVLSIPGIVLGFSGAFVNEILTLAWVIVNLYIIAVEFRFLLNWCLNVNPFYEPFLSLWAWTNPVFCFGRTFYPKIFSFDIAPIVNFQALYLVQEKLGSLIKGFSNGLPPGN